MLEKLWSVFRSSFVWAPHASRTWLLLLAAWVCVTSLWVASPAAVVAQEEETLSDMPAATAEQDVEPTGRRGTVLDTILDGGVVGFIIMLLSVVALGFAIEHGMTIRKKTLMPDDEVADLEQLIAQGQLDQAIEYCREGDHPSLFSAVVLAGLERYKASEFGFAEYKAAVEEAGEDHTGRLYRKTEVLGVIGSIAPMLGLLGTVLGMIQAFNVIASKEGAANPADLASGIGQALVTTLMGLVVAIPTMVTFSYFRNKIDSIIAEAGKRVEQVLTPLGRRK